MNQARADSCDVVIAEESYLAERYSPQPGQPFYLVLSDLLIALEKYSTTESIRILDFGCGGSPYRRLFPNAEYVRADLGGGDNLDFIIGKDNTIDAKPESFDLVLSTQVLEHIEHADKYLSECYRLLKPGGRLLLSTHGIFEEHGCPYDFRRWTADGLRSDMSANGFAPEIVYKLTTGGRAMAFLMDRYGGWITISRRVPVGVLFWLINRNIRYKKRQFHIWCDRMFTGCRVVEASQDGNSMYIVLLASARKPAAERF